MKLKKIASLALAGMMAVSMLAACGNTNGNANSNGSSSTPTTGGETEVIPASTLVALFNNKQDVNNKVQITFTADAKLESALQKAFDEIGGYTVSKLSQIPGYVQSQLGADPDMKVDSLINITRSLGSYYTSDPEGKTGLYFTGNSLNEKDGNTKTYIGLYVVSGSSAANGSMTPEATVNSIFATLNPKVFNKLPETYGTITPDQKYAAYSYTGSVCGMTVANESGAPILVVAMKITQTVNVKTGSKV